MRSAYGAEEGDNVSICYTDSLWPTAARRENLVYSKVGPVLLRTFKIDY